MKKHLLFTFLTVCMGWGTVSAQSSNDSIITKDHQSGIEMVELHDHHASPLFTIDVYTNEFMLPDLTMSLHSILSSDSGFDFNCQGGFCMQQKHIHKKGLSQNKQLFSYFMNVTG